ncbi:hypothetical protein ARMGADRAFT_1066728 [Armillaria gallica]|uniref:Uncharacterized protein n=1 Tax=Armillaria gallica TaxID=47427 RepID=A0A2H3DAN1_ARMGA|nr:hypothetical protein ARMGADRAFT_1066728 [Armillaria gallica]
MFSVQNFERQKEADLLPWFNSRSEMSEVEARPTFLTSNSLVTQTVKSADCLDSSIMALRMTIICTTSTLIVYRLAITSRTGNTLNFGANLYHKVIQILVESSTLDVVALMVSIPFFATNNPYSAYPQTVPASVSKGVGKSSVVPGLIALKSTILLADIYRVANGSPHSQGYIAWTNAFNLNILANGCPYALEDTDIEYRTRHACRLASRWLADCSLIPDTSSIGSPVSEIKFQECSEWSLNDAIFTGVKLKMEAESETSVAVSLIVLLCLDINGTPHEIHSVETDLRPLVGITGDIIALDDDASETLISNIKTEEQALLDDVGDTQHEHCLQVVFNPTTTLVVRAHSITLYTGPPLPTCIATHCYGWFDGARATPTSILIRSESENPWSLELNSLELHSLSSSLPTLVSKIVFRHGALRCTDVVLCKSATTVWILPHDRAMVSHWEKHDGREIHTAAVVPGPFSPNAEVRVCEGCMNGLNNWAPEDLGRIAL